MKSETITTRTGERLTLHQAADGKWCCPVCGSPELALPPYSENGDASFAMCSCGFEFGFDDDPAACAQALPGVIENIERWRSGVVAKYRHEPAQRVEELRERLRSIGVTDI